MLLNYTAVWAQSQNTKTKSITIKQIYILKSQTQPQSTNS